MDIKIQISEPGVDEAKIASLSRQLMQSIKDDGIGIARSPAESGERGSKGDPVTIGAIILSLIGDGGVAGKLIDVLRSIVDRRPTIEIELEGPAGKKMKLNATNL